MEEFLKKLLDEKGPLTTDEILTYVLTAVKAELKASFKSTCKRNYKGNQKRVWVLKGDENVR